MQVRYEEDTDEIVFTITTGTTEIEHRERPEDARDKTYSRLERALRRSVALPPEEGSEDE